MNFADIKDLTVDELRKREKTLRSEYTELKMKHAMGQVANPLEVRVRRRDIARIKTALSSKLK